MLLLEYKPGKSLQTATDNELVPDFLPLEQILRERVKEVPEQYQEFLESTVGHGISLKKYREQLKSLAEVAGIEKKDQSFFCKAKLARHKSHRPTAILQGLHLYKYTTTSLENSFGAFNVDLDVFNHSVKANYSETDRGLELATNARSQLYLTKAQAIMEGEIPEEYYEETKHGGKRLTTAGINHMRNQTDFYFRMAAVSERRSVNEKKELVVKSEITIKATSINIDLILNADPNDLGKLL